MTLPTLKGLRDHRGSPEHYLTTACLTYILNEDGLHKSFCSSKSQNTWVLALSVNDLTSFPEETTWPLVCPVLPSTLRA